MQNTESPDLPVQQQDPQTSALAYFPGLLMRAKVSMCFKHLQDQG